MTSLPSARRYLALFFPWLPIERLRNCRPHLCAERPEAPAALVEKVKGAMRLAAIDRHAAELGLAPGLTLADARARVPDLEVFAHEPHADRDWLERIADGCARYTPGVAIDPPDGLVLDIAGSAHLFGGEAALAADIAARLGRRGVVVRHAVAATPEGARALARFPAAPAPDEASALRRLPVAALGLDAEATLALSRAGLKTVGDVAKRRVAGIAARFGADAATALRRLLGEAESPLTPRRLIAPIGAERRFAEPVARTEHALEVLAELLGQAAVVLGERSEGGRRFVARFFRSDGLVQRLAVETGRPTREPRAVMRLFRERIDALADPIDPGFGYDLIRLDVALAEPLDAAQLKLEGGEVAEAEVAALLDRLGARLGKGRVRRFVPRDTHVPEQAELMLPVSESAAIAWEPPEPGEPPLRPIHLFDPPQAIDVLAVETPDGPPARFRWRRALYDVARVEGPERIAMPWWGRREAPTRDYYRIEDRRGRRFWVFRRGEYGGEAHPGWYVHGLFA